MQTLLLPWEEGSAQCRACSEDGCISNKATNARMLSNQESRHMFQSKTVLRKIVEDAMMTFSLDLPSLKIRDGNA
ncbi:Uncharacterized protein TCM_016055 [Theobroma cacao]|uniref:Uncharacterized protein n=1 Tax=Theobroma cacao TaxID=3641 RepID=A0A061G3L7_THECC|nr:Uncharacterized protein TCM_016055 [Theobroma cacao]